MQDHKAHEKRFNTCSEKATIKAAKILFGIDLTYDSRVNNDTQCDLSTLFAKIPGHDLVIANPRLGQQAVAIEQANARALTRVRNESGLTDLENRPEMLSERIVRELNDDWGALEQRLDREDIREEQTKLDRYKTEELTAIIAPIRQMMAEALKVLTPPNVYMLRTGKNGESGHFHTLYYQEPDWILDSGLKDGQPNVGVLYSPKTQQLGAMATQLIDASSHWGLGCGQRMIGIYEMNALRTPIVARYIEAYRQLDSDATELITPEDYVNQIIAAPDYLETFGASGYWRAQQHDQPTSLPKISEQCYIEHALTQCDQDLIGAITQLQQRGYFNHPEQGKTLLSLMLTQNKINVVQTILRQDLIELNTETTKELYQAAQQFSRKNPECPPGLNPSLRALQNKLLTVAPPLDELPFTVEDACEALNENALKTMLLSEDNASTLHKLTESVMAAARACHSTPSTYQPLLDVIVARQQEISHRSILAKPSLNSNTASAQSLSNESQYSPRSVTLTSSSFLNSNHTVKYTKSHFQPLETTLRRLAENTEDTAQSLWNKACNILNKHDDYQCPPGKEKQIGHRSVTYRAEKSDGFVIEKVVSENEQILLDELFAKKLAEENSYGPKQ